MREIRIEKTARCLTTLLFGAVALFFALISAVLLLTAIGAWGDPAALLLFMGAGVTLFVACVAGRWAWRAATRSAAAPASDDRTPGVCPYCGEQDVFRGLIDERLPRMRYFSRCLTCGERERVSKAIWRRLPAANPGDPYEEMEDRYHLAKNSPLSHTRGWALVAFVGLALLAAWAFTWAIQRLWAVPSPAHLTGILFFGLMYLAMGVWLRWFPPPRRPGRRCVSCGYDLRGASGGRCPECGRRIGAIDVGVQPLQHQGKD